MSMENGFELDFPGNDDNAETCEFGCMPMDHGEIGEPDAASMDEMPRVITKMENPELVLTARGHIPVTVVSPTLEVRVDQPHGRTFHLSFTRRPAHGTSTETIRLKNEDELRRTFHAIGTYLGEWPA